ncbi:hypothetical protein GCM10010371_67430 [Streptomyces subrutilus]|uniref:Uncharacterized protein n=1 Tax=Streptomyces subrutilus TaxID=36818 RepID=A0A918RFN0_9ACTN|nr:hypothetical protein GCM10010371_67430 [Streptomyces subrutilus]
MQRHAQGAAATAQGCKTLRRAVVDLHNNSGMVHTWRLDEGRLDVVSNSESSSSNYGRTALQSRTGASRE